MWSWFFFFIFPLFCVFQILPILHLHFLFSFFFFSRSPGTADSQIEKRVIDAVEDYLESCSQVIVDIDVVERLLRPENLEVFLRYVLKHANYGRSNIFQLFDTSEKSNHFMTSK